MSNLPHPSTNGDVDDERIDQQKEEQASAPASCSAELEWLNAECFDLRCESGGGEDADVIWIVYSHHMAKPVLRAEGYGKTAIEAIRDAMLPKGDPRRWDYVPEDPQNSTLSEPSS